MFRLLIAVFVTLFFSGCAPLPLYIPAIRDMNKPVYSPAPKPPEGKALVYFYREDSMAFGARDAYLYVNEKNIFDLSTNQYSYIYITPGTYEISQKWAFDISTKIIKQPLIARNGETYYFRVRTTASSNGNTMTFWWDLKEIQQETAETEIKSLKFKQQNEKITNNL